MIIDGGALQAAPRNPFLPLARHRDDLAAATQQFSTPPIEGHVALAILRMFEPVQAIANIRLRR